MKKLISFLFATLLTFQALAYVFQSGDLYYNITSSTEHTVAVTYQYQYSSSNYSSLTSADIPEKVTYNGIEYSVTSIGELAFYNCRGLTSVTIPNSVTEIGRSAFYKCGNLTTIDIPKSVIKIGQDAFSGNTTINCESTSKPDGWADNWNNGNTVVWANSNITAATESSATSVNIYAHGNTIVVENADAEIRVYNAMGALVGREAQPSVSTEIHINTTVFTL